MWVSLSLFGPEARAIINITPAVTMPDITNPLRDERDGVSLLPAANDIKYNGSVNKVAIVFFMLEILLTQGKNRKIIIIKVRPDLTKYTVDK
jgi:hypothetical protein